MHIIKYPTSEIKTVIISIEGGFYSGEDVTLMKTIEEALSYFSIVVAVNGFNAFGKKILCDLGLGHLLDKIKCVGIDDARCSKIEDGYFSHIMSICGHSEQEAALIIEDGRNLNLLPAYKSRAGGIVCANRIEEVTSIMLGLMHQKKYCSGLAPALLPDILKEASDKMSGEPFILGVSGRAGAGKRTFADKLAELALNENIPASRLSLDHFFFLSSSQRRKWIDQNEENRNQILWWDLEAAQERLDQIKRGEEIFLNHVYDRDNKGEKTGRVFIPAGSPLVIFEGVAILHLENIDHMIYLDVPDTICFHRILSRDSDRRQSFDDFLKRFCQIKDFENMYFKTHQAKIDRVLENSSLVPLKKNKNRLKFF